MHLCRSGNVTHPFLGIKLQSGRFCHSLLPIGKLMIGVDVCQDGTLELDLLSYGFAIDAQKSGSPNWLSNITIVASLSHLRFKSTSSARDSCTMSLKFLPTLWPVDNAYNSLSAELSAIFFSLLDCQWIRCLTVPHVRNMAIPTCDCLPAGAKEESVQTVNSVRLNLLDVRFGNG